MKTSGSDEVITTAANSGKVAGDEIVQLIRLAPGESKTVRFAITTEMLAIYDLDLHHVVEPGEFEIIVTPHLMPGKPRC